MTVAAAIPKAFIWRRVHSLMGLWLVLFLIEHLLVNSQAALWLGAHGQGFVDLVNGIHNLPYLQAIEVALLGIPLLVHAGWGIRYALTSKSNYRRSDGSAPVMKTSRNRGFHWQRITSWILLIGLIAHVVKFRFVEYPVSMSLSRYAVVVSVDDRLYGLSHRLGVELYDAGAQKLAAEKMEARHGEMALVAVAKSLQKEEYSWTEGPLSQSYDEQKAIIIDSAQDYEEDLRFTEQLTAFSLENNQVVAVAKDFGTATLLAVRNTFKSPLYAIGYTLFVLAACFHAMNGFWTFLLTWGWILKMSAQRAWTRIVAVLMLGLVGLGLAAIWGAYWHGAI